MKNTKVQVIKMRVNIDLCYNCICKACSRFYCPYRGGRCKRCDYFTRKKLYDCDFFEYYKIAPKRLKIVRKAKPSKDIVSQKLDAIIEYLGMDEVKIMLNGTYGVFWKNSEMVFKGSKTEVNDYVRKYQSGFNNELTIKPLRIDI